MTGKSPIEVKICGLTDPDQAAACADLGAASIGCVFFPKSPRHVSVDIAAAICRAVPEKIPVTGVFVNASADEIIRIAEKTGIRAAQLHGNERPELAERVAQSGLIVIKAFFITRDPNIRLAGSFPARACLVEYGGGKLPGGNAESWNWDPSIKPEGNPKILLAGGIRPETAVTAVTSFQPDAIDLSSGVESAPGIKDIARIRDLFNNLNQIFMTYQPRSVFS